MEAITKETSVKRYYASSPIVRLGTLTLSVIGLSLSIYLSITHFAGTQILYCSAGGFVNCAQVTTSPQSYMFAVPVAFYGVVFFVAQVALCLPWAWASRFGWVPNTRYALAACGVVMVSPPRVIE
jgi:uncharacterized membrane protein